MMRLQSELQKKGCWGNSKGVPRLYRTQNSESINIGQETQCQKSLRKEAISKQSQPQRQNLQV